MAGISPWYEKYCPKCLTKKGYDVISYKSFCLSCDWEGDKVELLNKTQYVKKIRKIKLKKLHEKNI